MNEKIKHNAGHSPFFKMEKPFARQALRRYSALSAILGGDKNFGKLAAAILQKPLNPTSSTGWDSIRGYEGVLGALISFVTISDDAFQSMAGTSNLTDASALQDGFYDTNGVSDPAVIIGTRMRKKEIGKGLSVAEIGGSVSCRVMEALGATCVHTDAGYRASSRPLTLWKKAGDFFLNPDDLITLDRYKHKFSNQYDFTVSNRLLDAGSGAEAIAEGAGQASVSAGAMELLATFSNMTKYRGYSIHGGLTARMPSKFFDYLGFDVIMRTGISRNSLTIFEKRDPHPDLWPDGVKIGHKTIHFDCETECFFLRR